MSWPARGIEALFPLYCGEFPMLTLISPERLAPPSRLVSGGTSSDVSDVCQRFDFNRVLLEMTTLCARACVCVVLSVSSEGREHNWWFIPSPEPPRSRPCILPRTLVGNRPSEESGDFAVHTHRLLLSFYIVLYSSIFFSLSLVLRTI